MEWTSNLLADLTSSEVHRLRGLAIPGDDSIVAFQRLSEKDRYACSAPRNRHNFGSVAL